jgi:predicted neuraminidase
VSRDGETAPIERRNRIAEPARDALPKDITMKSTVPFFALLLLAPLAELHATEEPDSAAMLPAQVRQYDLDVMRRIADLALIPPKLNTSPLPQYDYDRLDYGMTIGIDRTPKGRLWACWVAGGDSPKAFFVLATSDDNGETWSKPRLVVDAHSPNLPMDRSVLVGNLWTDPLGRLWLIFDQSMDMFDGRAGVWASVCENPDAAQPQWSAPRRIWHGVTLNKPTVLSSGEWMLPISLDQREGFGPFKGLFKELDSLRGANVFVSTDKGATWQRRGAVRFPKPDWHEHMIVQRKDGSLWMLARTSKGIMQTTSTDAGQTWAEPTEPPGIRQPNARFHIRRLASGKLLFVKHGKHIDRHEGRSQLTAWLSEDDGKTWKGGLMLDERKGVSYPDGFQAPDGTIFISYDRNRATDGEILLARFTEEDIQAKKIIGPKSKLKLLISRPLGIKKESPRPKGPTAGIISTIGATFVSAGLTFLPVAQQDEPASLAPPKHVGHPLPEHFANNRAFQGIPSLAVAPRGRLWATWYAGVTPAEDKNNYAVLTTSGDGGKTWKEVLTIDPDGNGPVRAFDPELWVSPDGRLFSFWAQMDTGRRDTRLGVWCIETTEPDADHPKWSPPRRIGDGVMMCKPLVLSTREWVLPISTWREHNDSAQMVVSTDKGKTWRGRGGCNVPVGARQFDEHMYVERRDGSLWLLVRTRYGIGESVSTDGGKSWPELKPSEIPHTSSRFFIRRLTSGNLLLVKHGPFDKKTGRSHLMAFISWDDGKTWGGGLMLDERLGVSYPDGQQTSSDGLIRIIYDYSRTGERNILLATFREEDAAAGKETSKDVHLRQLVSKASGGKEKKAVPAKPKAIPEAVETDARLHADGKGWRLDTAKIIDPNRPRVLLVGDSILSGYLKSVIAQLQGKAYVDAWVNPYHQSEHVNKLLAEVLANGPYDVVHFNMGLHGWQKGRIKEGSFEPLTRAYVQVIKDKLPRAKAIWASSTPVTVKYKPGELFPEINDIIIEHNRLAAKVMKEMDVPVNDFYALLAPRLELARGDQFHWKPEAYKLLADQVVASILRALSK